MTEKILVIGKPGSGKTSYVKNRLGLDGIAYDLDAIAGAFRLTCEHEERHEAARRMADSMFLAFSSRAQDFAKRVYLIRTAPTLAELSQIRPDRVVLCTGIHDIRNRKDFCADIDMFQIETRIEDAKKFCELNLIPFEIPPEGKN